MEDPFQRIWQGLEQAVVAFRTNPKDPQVQAFFQEYRGLQNVIQVSQYILERTKTHSVQWHALRAISDAIIQRWDTLSLGDIMQALQFTIQFINNEAPKLTNEAETIINQAMLIIATSCKRGWLDPSSLKDSATSLELKSALHATVIGFLSNESPQSKILGMKLITTLCEEFSSNSKTATKINMPWEFHVEAFNTFEQTALLQFFEMASSTLNTIMQRTDQILINSMVKRLFKETIVVLSHCLTWPFGQGGQAILGFGWSRSSTISLTPEWRKVLVETPAIVDLFFRVFKLVKSESDNTASNVKNALICLANFSEASFTEGLGHRVQYMAYFSSQLRPFMSAAMTGGEFYTLGQIAETFVNNIPIGAFAAAFNDEFQQFCVTLYGFSERTLQLYSRDVDNQTRVSDSFSMILGSWVALVQSDQCPKYAVEGAVRFFDLYVTARLARAREELLEDEARTDENGYEIVDRTYYSDELESISKLGRCASLNAITQLGMKVSVCMNHVQQWLANNGAVDFSIAEVWEELHWLILFSGYLLTDDTPGETPTLPIELTMPSQALDEHLAQGGADPLVALSEAIFTLVQWLNQELANHAERVHELKQVARASGTRDVDIPPPRWSALIAEDLLWFTSRWCRYYLLIPPNQPDAATPVRASILARFGANTQSALEICNFIFQTAWLNLVHWGGESKCQFEAIEILTSIASRRFPSAVYEHCPAFQVMVETHQRDGAVLFGLDSHIQRRLLKCLCLLEVGQSEADRAAYMVNILHPVEARWQSVLNLSSDPKQRSLAMRQTKKLLERCRGVVLACSSQTWQPIYAFTKRLFRVWLQCMKIFDVDADLVLIVLKLISDCTKKLSDWLPDNDSDEFLGELMSFFRLCDELKLGRFQKPRESGRRNRELEALEDEKEQELYEILCTLEVISEIPRIKAAEATSFGLHMMFACITRDMLKYTEIEVVYFRIAANLFHRHTARLHLLSDELFLLLLTSFEFALTQGKEKVERKAFESLQTLAEYLFQPPADAAPFSPAKRAAIPQFVEVVLQYLLFEDGFKFDMVDTASSAFLSLICLEKDSYPNIVRNLIAQQPPPIQGRLGQYFESLLHDIELSTSKENQRKFREKMRAFLSAARGILGRK